MNQYLIQPSVVATREEMISVSVSERREYMVCPKPRRLDLLNDHHQPVRSLRWNFSHQSAETFDSKAGSDLFDIILPKGGYGEMEQSATQVASSPPFFSGSPPSRVANPLIHDSRFGDHNNLPHPSPSSSSSSRKKGGCNFGNKPAVRVEGFDCLDRDRRNCSIPTLA